MRGRGRGTHGQALAGGMDVNTGRHACARWRYLAEKAKKEELSSNVVTGQRRDTGGRHADAQPGLLGYVLCTHGIVHALCSLVVAVLLRPPVPSRRSHGPRLSRASPPPPAARSSPLRPPPSPPPPSSPSPCTPPAPLSASCPSRAPLAYAQFVGTIRCTAREIFPAI